jgi:hypothetical protein
MPIGPNTLTRPWANEAGEVRHSMCATAGFCYICDRSGPQTSVLVASSPAHSGLQNHEVKTNGRISRLPGL